MIYFRALGARIMCGMVQKRGIGHIRKDGRSPCDQMQDVLPAALWFNPRAAHQPPGQRQTLSSLAAGKDRQSLLTDDRERPVTAGKDRFSFRYIWKEETAGKVSEGQEVAACLQGLYGVLTKEPIYKIFGISKEDG